MAYLLSDTSCSFLSFYLWDVSQLDSIHARRLSSDCFLRPGAVVHQPTLPAGVLASRTVLHTHFGHLVDLDCSCFNFYF